MRCQIPTRDLNQRLSGTIIRVNGEPSFVLETQGNSLVIIPLNEIDSRKKKPVVLDAADPAVDIASPLLGYANLYESGRVKYYARQPSRIYKQGLDFRNMRYSSLGSREWHPSQATHETYEALHKTIKGEFPKLDTALRMLKSGDVNEVAIHRDIALALDKDLQIIVVYFKNSKVGYMNLKENILHVQVPQLAWVASLFLKGYEWEIKND